MNKQATVDYKGQSVTKKDLARMKCECKKIKEHLDKLAKACAVAKEGGAIEELQYAADIRAIFEEESKLPDLPGTIQERLDYVLKGGESLVMRFEAVIRDIQELFDAKSC